MSEKQKCCNDDKAECYGKHSEQSPRCRECELKNPCKNRTEEPKENLRYAFQHISVPQVFFDGGESGDADGELLEAANAYYSQTDGKEKNSALILDGITIPEKAKYIVFQVISRLAEFYFHTPHVFEAIMQKAFHGKSQSDLAREKFISRQCVNKRLLKDLGIAQKRHDVQQRRDAELAEAKESLAEKEESLRQKDHFLQSLSERDWRIYKLHFIDGCSEISTANQVGCSRRTVSTVAQFLRKGLSENCTIKRGRKKKNDKKNIENNAPRGR